MSELEKKTVPFGQSVLPRIFRRDPQSNFIKQFYLLFTSIVLVIFPCFPYLTQYMFDNSIQTYSKINIYQITEIIGLSQHNLYLAITITFMVYFLLIIMDISGVEWPKNFNTKSVECYFEMFSETKRNAFIGHFGNAISNFMYLFDGLCVLFSCYNYEGTNQFFISDILFGINLILLSLFSFIWHASNAPKSHYFDLWVMDNCIVYLPIRYICVALFKFGYIYWTQQIGIIGAIILYSYFIIMNGKHRLTALKNGLYDKSCSFSSRNLLYNNNTHQMLKVKDVCFYALMPIIFSIAPMVVFMYVGSMGHIVTLTIAMVSLFWSWSVRMFERWTLDGWFPINKWKHNMIISAFMSPTAILHVSTGVTLITGYIHIRSLPIS